MGTNAFILPFVRSVRMKRSVSILLLLISISVSGQLIRESELRTKMDKGPELMAVGKYDSAQIMFQFVSPKHGEVTFRNGLFLWYETVITLENSSKVLTGLISTYS